MSSMPRGCKTKEGHWVKRDIGFHHGYELEQKLQETNRTTLPAILQYCTEQYQDAPCLGTRTLISREFQMNDGKTLEKLEFGEYIWDTYNDVLNKVHSVAVGMTTLGIAPGARVAFFAETRADWFIAAVGCLRLNIPVVTIYPNLNKDGITHALKETECSVLFTSFELLPSILPLLRDCPQILHVIVMEDQLEGIGKDTKSYQDVHLIPLRELISLGGDKSNLVDIPFPSPDDVAIIMYTSGSTGKPKGVELTHSNIFHTIIAFVVQMNLVDTDRYLSYLPLAHVFELSCEAAAFTAGMKIGYSSPFTLTNKSPKIKEGTLGDVQAFKPTAMTAVPLILERIIKGVMQKVDSQGIIKSTLFHQALRYKEWASGKDFVSKLIDSFVFAQIKQELGGELRKLAIGGAQTSAKSQSIIRAMFGCPVQIGYGSTETTACITCMDEDDTDLGHCGPPNPGVIMRLENWEEGGYFVTDEPNPRGEILVGGPTVAKGYFKLEEETAHAFFEEDGVKWFRTGDIAEFLVTGVVRIIDRKTDLVKLKHGEYISLGKIELLLKNLSIIDNICIYANALREQTVALVVPSIENLRKIAITLNISADVLVDDLCRHEKLKQHILNELQIHCKNNGLTKWETPTALYLTPDPWTPETGLVTASLKLKRIQVNQHFQPQLEKFKLQ